MISGPGGLWTKVIEYIDRRIRDRLENAGIYSSTINAGNLSGVVNPATVQVERVGPVVVPASENLTAGDLVDIWNDSGTAKARKADASVNREANGFVIATVTSGDNARVFSGGTNDQIVGASAGQTLYLSATAGGVTTAAPTTSGYTVQIVGTATSTTSMVFSPRISILLA